MSFQVLDEAGKALDAHFDLDGQSIIFHSRKGSPKVNSQYGEGLRALLRRIVEGRLRITDAYVDSSTVQYLPKADRRILGPGPIPSSSAEIFTELSRRMNDVGRKPSAKTSGGNTTKKIRLELDVPTGADLPALLGAEHSSRDLRSRDRLPAEQLSLVKPHHIYAAVTELTSTLDFAPFGDSTDYDLLLDDGQRLPPKAVFGRAATAALGMEVLPRHFVGGIDSFCFRALEKCGLVIVPKGDSSEDVGVSSVTVVPAPEDREWTEGRPKRVEHLRRERKSGAAQAKRSKFIEEHGQLFCERCMMVPQEVYGSQDGDACIEVHHVVPLSATGEGTSTRLEDLQCLCASCHRVVHSEMRGKD